jgi:pantoate--beta-alanine ligase
MEIIRTVDWMKQVSRASRAKEQVIGLVPTMGALHQGHFSLVGEARKHCSQVVASIFVNPTQFGPSEDLAKYPRPFEKDVAALESLGVDFLFAPSVQQMYPKGFSTYVSVEQLGDRLEGRSRPGHFRGVATVVLKLFEAVQPHLAFFGRKDAQQLAVIRRMVRDLEVDAQIVACPIIREPDGLALSSRNVYLNEQARAAATTLSGSLALLRAEIDNGERDIVRLLADWRAFLGANREVVLDYAEIVDAETFESVMNLRGTCYAVLAAKVGGTRLIDNALIEQSADRFIVTL